MSLWAYALASLLLLFGLIVLLLALVHVRYEAAWFGLWAGGASLPHESNLRLEFGFPGFMRVYAWGGGTGPRPESELETSDGTTTYERQSNSMGQAGEYGGDMSGPPGVEDARSSSATSTTNQTRAPAPQPEKQTATAPPSPPKKDPHRYRKTLFRLGTDRETWALLLGYGVRVFKKAVALLGLRVELATGHPDPAFLGRFAGLWYAVAPVIAPKGTSMAFRFQDQNPSMGARISGGFSLLSLIWFFAGSVLAFPLFRLAARAWHGWRHRDLMGWRAYAYRKIQTL